MKLCHGKVFMTMMPCSVLHDFSLHDFSEHNFSRIDGLYVATQSRGIWNKGRNNGTGGGLYRFASLAVGLWMMGCVGVAFAQQAQPPAASESCQRRRQNLPAYFTATNDPQKPAWPDATGGASGVWATPASDGKGDVPEQLKPTDLYDRILHNLYSINYVWVLIAGFLVMFMQAGFMLVETALCRAKNSAHTAAMNLMIYPLGCLAFWVYGFAIGWGNWWNGPVPPGWYPSLGPGLSVLTDGWGLGAAVDAAGKATGAFTYGLIGLKGWFLTNAVGDAGVMALFFFMMVFMDTTATIPTGAMAERWAWKNFCLFGLWVALPYCLYANWVWGGGWLAQGGVNWGLGHGAVDFAGSGVVHTMGGVIALAGAMIIGPRIGKYDVQGGRRPCRDIACPWSVLGTFILAFGWFGFNPGSTLAGTDLRISFVVVNTMLAGIVASLVSMLTLMLKGLKPDPTMCCNGMLAGLVAITAPCAFVNPLGAVIIGAVAGWLVVVASFSGKDAASMIRSARSPCTASTASGACCRSGSSPPGSTARDGMVWCVKGS